MCVGVATEPGVGLEQGHRSGAAQHVRGTEPGDTTADDGNASRLRGGHALPSPSSNIAMGALLGDVEPLLGSTVIPTAVALVASPLSSTL